MQTNDNPTIEFKNTLSTQELISILDKLTEWAKGKEEMLVPVLEGLTN